MGVVGQPRQRRLNSSFHKYRQNFFPDNTKCIYIYQVNVGAVGGHHLDPFLVVVRLGAGLVVDQEEVNTAVDFTGPPPLDLQHRSLNKSLNNFGNKVSFTIFNLYLL